MYILTLIFFSDTDKATESKPVPPKEGPPQPETAPIPSSETRQEGETGDETHNATATTDSNKGSMPPSGTKREDVEVKTRESVEASKPPAPAARTTPSLSATSNTGANGTNGNSTGPSANTGPGPGSGSATKGRSSKTSTPAHTLAATAETQAPAQQNTRQTRSTDPTPAVRRSQKNPPPRAASEDDEESVHEGDDDEDGEPRYCYCNEISFGDMVACDNDKCPREWFHLACVGLSKPPGKNGEWCI